MGSLAEALNKAGADEANVLATGQVVADDTTSLEAQETIVEETVDESPIAEEAIDGLAEITTDPTDLSAVTVNPDSTKHSFEASAQANAAAEASADLDDIISTLETELSNAPEEMEILEPDPATPEQVDALPEAIDEAEPDAVANTQVDVDDAPPDAESLIAVPTHYGPTHTQADDAIETSPSPTESPDVTTQVEPAADTATGPISDTCWDLVADQELTEQYREIRRTLMARLPSDQAQVVAMVEVSGAGSDATTQAASTVAALNLGTVLAEIKGTTAVVVDADFTDRRLTDLLGLDSETGLTDVLNGCAAIGDVIQPGLVGHLDIIAGGNHEPPSADELLHGDQALTLFRELRERYDFVLVDAAGTFSADRIDAFAALFTGVILVTRADATVQKHAKILVRRLEAKHVNILGCILTADPS